MSTQLDALKRLGDLAGAVGEYRGSAQSVLMVDLLKAIEEHYVLEIIDCKPDELVALQSKLKQCAALRDVLSGGAADGRI